MASNEAPASSQQPKKQGNLGLFDLSHQEIKTKICATHVHDDEKYCDVQSLFIVVENILKRATLQVADNVGTQATVEHLEEKTPNASFIPPLYTLKSISYEMQCKYYTGKETAYETTVQSILNKLSNYSWDTKALLTLTAFALDYGEFWLLAQSLQSSNSDKVLTESVATLRRVSVPLKDPIKQAIIELKNVIKAALEVIERIFELEKLLNQIDEKDLADDIPVYVFWAIVIVVASTTQLCCLTSGDHDKQQELTQFSRKLEEIFNELERRIKICKQKIEEAETYLKLKRLFLTATKILDVLEGLINSKVNVQPLIDGSTKERVNIDVLEGKNVLLLISGLDISDEDISILRQVYDSIRNDDQYKIVWLPIVDQWNEYLQNKFDSLQSKMPWYVVHHFSSIAGIRIVKEKWYFMGKPCVVVSNSPGREEHVYEINMIRLLGIEVFPFNNVVAEIISNEIDLIGSLATNLHPNIKKRIQDDQKYIFFYGGNDEWIEQFTNRASVVAKDAAIKEARISIELACVEKGSEGEDNRGRFWTGIESMFFSKTHRKTDSTDSMIGEIWKLLHYKNESGWAILSKGSNVVLSGQGTTIMKVVEDFDKWKELVLEKGLDVTIKDQHKKVLRTTTHICRRIDVISNTSGIIPYQNMKCPYCDRTMVMETYISFKYCCHAH